MAVIYTQHYAQFFDNNGDPLSNGKLYAYFAGTTTPKATFTTEAGNIQHAHPIELDASGRSVIFIEGSYRFDLFDENNSLIRSVDNVSSFTTLNEAGEAFFQSFSGDGNQTVFTLSDDLGSESKSLMVFLDSGAQNHVENGTFATDTDWTKGIGWTIGSGVATATGDISTAIEQVADISLVQNNAYILTYTVTRSAGSITPAIGGVSGVERSTSGTFTEIIIAGATQNIAFTGAGFTGTLDNIVIRSVGSTGYEIQSPSSFTVSGTSLTFSVAPPSGVDNIFVFAPTKLLGAAAAAASLAEAAETGALAAQTAAQAAEAGALAAETNAETAEANAETAAVQAALSAARLQGTSATSVAIGTGTAAFTTQADKFFNVGNWLLIASDANEANYMHGQVTAYAGTALEVNITNIGGSGTFDDWLITLSGTHGVAGATGATGPAGSGLAAVVNDTTPQLGGNLDVNGQSIVSVSNGNIVITPHGVGTVNISKANITGGSVTGITDLAIADGGTGASTAAGARTALSVYSIAETDALISTVTPWVAYTPTFTGFGTVTSIEFFSRLVGDTLEVEGKCTVGTVSATEARISLGYDGTNGNATINSLKVPTGTSIAGICTISVSTGGISRKVLKEPSVTYMTFSRDDANGFTKINGNIVLGNTNQMTIKASFPVTIS